MKMITYFMKPHLIVLLNLDNLLSNFDLYLILNLK